MISPIDTKTRGRRWRVRVYDPVRRGWRHVGSYATKREAREAQATAISADQPPTRGSTTVSEWRALWLSTSQVKDSTRAWHRDRTTTFEKAHGHDLLAHVTRGVAIDWASRNRSTVQALSAMWTAAIRVDLAAENPWRGLALQHHRKIEPGWLTEDDIARISRAAHQAWPGEYGSVVAAYILFSAYVGARPGEIAGLRWKDLEPTAGRLHIRRQAESRTRQITTPKGDRARLVIYPQVAQRAVARMPRTDDTLVFTGPGGGILFSSTRNRVWHPVRVAAGRPGMELYELRHWCATWLVEQGLSSSDVAIQLGHTDGGALVESTYGHARPAPALARLAEALAQAKDPDRPLADDRPQEATA